MEPGLPRPAWPPLLPAASRSLRRSVPVSLAYPTTYLLSCPAIQGDQLAERRLRTEIVLIEHRPAGAGYVGKGQLAFEEIPNRRFVRGVQHGAARAAEAHHFVNRSEE